MKTGEIRAKFVTPFGVVITSCLLALSLHGGVQSGEVQVRSVTGKADYSTDGLTWTALKSGAQLSSGTIVRTESKSTVDMVLKYNGSVWRLSPDSRLKLEKLATRTAGEETITETRLNLEAGTLVGSQRKLAKPSVLEIAMQNGMAVIRGTEYVINADGAVSVLDGVVSVNYNLPGAGGSVKVTILAGFTFDPALGLVVPTTAQYLQNIIADVNTVKKNAEVFKVGGATIVVKADTSTVSPTAPKGNNGVGNGIDPQPPGNPPINDGPGTSPGNPGNKGGAKK